TGKIVVLVGPNGSPVASYPHILADRLAPKQAPGQVAAGQMEPFAGLQDPLNTYKAVVRLDLRQVCSFASTPRAPEPFPILEAAKQHALAAKAILLLEGPEVLGGRGPVDEPMRSVLNDYSDGLVFAMYAALPDERIPDVEREWGLSNVVVIPVHAYT